MKEWNFFLALPFMMSRKMNTSLQGITWELFHYTSVWDEHGTFYVASELKALEGYCTKIQLFPPGHYMTVKMANLYNGIKRDWTDYDAVKITKQTFRIKVALEAAVHRQLMSDVL
jgi:asparagine synthetase B (glutamine-hydrolysing)